MNMINSHLLLVAEPDLYEAGERVRHFFDKNFLVKYDRVTVIEQHSLPADHNEFWSRLNNGIKENRGVVKKLLAELQESGFENLADLAGMERGYDSKVLHITTHLLDGFFGVDTFFYNLEEDSHSLSERLTETIRANPNDYWLIEVECATTDGHESNQLDLIRKLDVAPPKS